MKTTLIPKNACRTCGAQIDATTGLTHRASPKEGDISICFYCGTVSEFDENLNRVAVDLATLEDDVRVEVENFVRKIKKTTPN